MPLVIAVISHIHKMLNFSSQWLASEDGILLESTHSGSELCSWVSHSLSSCVFSFSFSFSVSSLSFSFPSHSPHPRFTHVLLVKFPCWALLIYRHTCLCYITGSLLKFNGILSSLIPGPTAFWGGSCLLTSELLFPVCLKIYQFHWQCVCLFLGVQMFKTFLSNNIMT